jgi:hypothetical protein
MACTVEERYGMVGEVVLRHVRGLEEVGRVGKS